MVFSFQNKKSQGRRRKIRAVLIPPKAKLLLITYSHSRHAPSQAEKDGDVTGAVCPIMRTLELGMGLTRLFALA
jgi:hypothetical protein